MAATLTEYLNTMYTTTWAKRRAGIVDQVFEENKLLKLLQSKGMIKFESTDGRRLEIPVNVKKTTTSKFFGKGATFTITDFDPLTVVYDYWKNLGDQIVRYWGAVLPNSVSHHRSQAQVKFSINVTFGPTAALQETGGM